MKFIRLFALSVVLVSIAACASPEFEASGTPTPFDGLWSGELKSSASNCKRLTVNGEIRYGKLIAKVFRVSRHLATVWGDVDSRGVLDGDIGKLGVVGGKGNVTFGIDGKATGSWSADGCSGTVEMSRS